jgi:rod shape determining protein RodA
VINIKHILGNLRKLNIMMFACMIALCITGVMFVYSSCSVREDPQLQMLYMRHAEVSFIGLFLYIVIACFKYRMLIKWSWIFYLGCLGLLVLVPLMGTEIMGAKRWVFGIQPSEFAKLAMIMTLAWLYGGRYKFNGFVFFILTGILIGVPSLLILAQPDLGTAMVMVPTTFAMMFAGNIAPRFVWSTLLIGVVVAGTVLGIIYSVEKVDMPQERKDALISATHLKPHQIKRLQVFLFPDMDLHGSGYNRRQSEIAVGSGGLHGKGYLKGEQYMLGYLPSSVSSNDFIFAVLAEESGFIGSVTVLLLFLGLLWPGLWIAHSCQDNVGRLFCVGVATLIFSHMFINIAMTIGLMPITGLPLPFISYGRTFMLTMMLALGLVQSVSIHGRKSAISFE